MWDVMWLCACTVLYVLVVHYIRYKIEWGGWDEMRWDEIFFGLGKIDEDSGFVWNSGLGFEWWLAGGCLKIFIMILCGVFFVERDSRAETREVTGVTQMRVCVIWYHGHGHFHSHRHFSLVRSPWQTLIFSSSKPPIGRGTSKNSNKLQHQTSGMLKSSCTHLMIWSHSQSFNNNSKKKKKKMHACMHTAYISLPPESALWHGSKIFLASTVRRYLGHITAGLRLGYVDIDFAKLQYVKKVERAPSLTRESSFKWMKNRCCVWEYEVRLRPFQICFIAERDTYKEMIASVFKLLVREYSSVWYIYHLTCDIEFKKSYIMPARSSIYIELYTPAAEKQEAIRMSLHTGGHRHGNDTGSVYESTVSSSSSASCDKNGMENSMEKAGTRHASILDQGKSVEIKVSGSA